MPFAKCRSVVENRTIIFLAVFTIPRAGTTADAVTADPHAPWLTIVIRES